MKHRILLSVILFLLAGFTLESAGQAQPFGSKMKSRATTSFAPQQLQPVRALPATPVAAGRTVTAFHPVTHPGTNLTGNGFKITERATDSNGRVVFLSGEPTGVSRQMLNTTASVSEACFAFLTAVRNQLGVTDPQSEFRISGQSSDELGMNHIRFSQWYQGVRVYGSDFYLHTRDNSVRLYNGTSFPTPSGLNTTPAIGSNQAATAASADLAGKTAVQSLTATQKALLNYDGPSSELVIYHKNRDPKMAGLCWHLTIRPNFLERWEYFVDAANGSIVHCYNNTQADGDVTSTGPDLNGVSRTIHAYQQGGSYVMVDASRPMFNAQNMEGSLRTYDANYTSPSAPGFNPAIATSANNSWGPKVISSQYNAGVTYEYFRTTHGKNSWNNQGGSILSVINATEQNGSGLDNAYWNGAYITYGNGESYFKPLAGALDVSAHELGHAYDEASANLEYQGQSGALNEAFSDIAGACVERQNWQIGEQVVKPGAFPTGCLRDMSNPHNGGSSLSDPGYQPAHMSEMYNGSDDNGGVHINSGIINFAFYKYSTAMGIAKGEMTFFRALFQYLTRSSQFIDCRLAVVQAAKDLYGDGSAEVNAAKTAFDEVGIQDGSGGNYQNQLPVNPGQDFVLTYNTSNFEPSTLEVWSTAGAKIQSLTQTGVINRPSIVDNGSLAVFVGTDKKMHALTLETQPQEYVLQDQPIWSNVAVSKDGTLLAAVTESQDSSIYIYSFQKQEWARAHLYNPTSQQGVVTNNVLYADALEWDYSGEFIMYDSYNQLNSSSTGQSIDYWDISFMKVWDKASSNWGGGEVYKMVTGLPEGISIGNPSLSKNSPSVCAFDYLDGNAGSASVLAGNLESGDFVEVYANGSTLSYPNYSKLDDKIIFNALYNGSPVVASIAMATDKIHPASAQAYVFISDAKWGIWFAQGNRPLGIDQTISSTVATVFPNPASGQATLQFGKVPTGMLLVQLFDTEGKMVKSWSVAAAASIPLDLNGIAGGLYVLKVTGNSVSTTTKLVIE